MIKIMGQTNRFPLLCINVSQINLMKITDKMKPTKSILILTDFSRSAKNASEYGTHLAKQLNANILLFNSFLIPDLGFDSWPSAHHESLLQQSKKSLEEEVARLHGISQHDNEEFETKIDYLSSEGAIAENVSAIIKDKQNIFMVVMGGCKANDNDDILFGVEITEILSKVKCPTVIVPESECFQF